MRLIDARTLDSRTVSIACDVCIVGAGAAGLFLAARLVRRGIDVVVVEAGDRICADGQAVGIETIVEDDSYRATSEGRAFGLGGTTSLWGGQLIPYSELDFRQAEANGFNPWRHIVGVVKRYSQNVADMLGLQPMVDWFDPSALIPVAVVNALHSRGLQIVTSDWLPFRKRNFAFLVKTLGVTRGNLSIFLNAPAITWDVRLLAEGLYLIASLTAKAGNRFLKILARSFVLAAGTIESTRILLEMKRQSPGIMLGHGAALGRYLSDHLSCRVANVRPEDLTLCSQLFAPRFLAGRMKTFRFVERHAPPDVLRGFFHFIFDNDNEGFHLVKKVLLGLQSRTLPKVSAQEMTRSITEIAALAWNRWVRQRLFIPTKTPVHLQLDIEQIPHPSNRVILTRELDAWGRPMAVVQWQIREEDCQAIHAAVSRFITLWPGYESGFPGLLPDQEGVSGYKPHDAYHPVGTCRMGVDSEAVVDPELRVHGVLNLSVLSTAVFPSAGTANPTFSMLCLAESLVERLAKELSVS